MKAISELLYIHAFIYKYVYIISIDAVDAGISLDTLRAFPSVFHDQLNHTNKGGTGMLIQVPA